MQALAQYWSQIVTLPPPSSSEARPIGTGFLLPSARVPQGETWPLASSAQKAKLGVCLKPLGSFSFSNLRDGLPETEIV